jgi:multiple sugar transport system substrate-binding protein
MLRRTTFARLRAILALLLVGLLLAACGDAPTNTSAPSATNATNTTTAVSGTSATTAAASGNVVEVTFAMNNVAQEVPGWTAQVEAANKLLAPKNIRIKIQSVAAQGWTEYYQKVAAQQAAGKSPDIGRAAESLMPVLMNRGQVVDISETVKELDMSKFFEKTFQGSAFKDGKYYGIPSGVYYMLLYYNKDLFDKAGVKYPSTDWDNSMTFEQTKETAKKLTQGNGATKQFGLSAGPYMAFMGMYSVSNGGKNVFNANGQCALNEQPSKEVYAWFDSMLRQDYSMPRPTDTKVTSALDMFKAGRVAMTIDGTWAQPTFKNDIKNFKVGIAAVPSGKGKASSSMFVDSWVVFKGAPHEREAREALKALNSAEAVSALAAKGTGGIPVRKDVLTSLQDELIGSQFSAEDKAAFTEGLNRTLGVPYNERYQEIDDKANQQMDAWLLGQMSADQYATKVCEIIDKK